MAVLKDGGGEEDSEDDDEIVVGVGENFRKHIDALKRACVLDVGHGGHIATPASILSAGDTAACDDDEEGEEEEEDDDELFLAIKNKYGSLGFGSSPWLGKSNTPGGKKLDSVADEDDEEEDDEEILRSVEKLYNKSGVDSGQQEQGRVLEVESPLKDSSVTNESLRGDGGTHPMPSPCGSPECEFGGVGGEEEDGGATPEARSESETNVEPGEDIGKAIVPFLPGSWIDTDGNVESGHISPAGPLEMVAIEHEGSDRCAPVEEPKEYSLPESAEILTDALKKNRDCQRAVRNLLSQVEAKQKENVELQKRVRSLVDFEKYCQRRFAGFFTDQANPSIKLISAKGPTAQNKTTDSSNKTVSDVQTCGPPENPDVEIYKALQKKVSFNFQTRRWSNEESAELRKGVKQQVYEVLVRRAMDALSNADALDEEFSSLEDHMSKIGGKEFTPMQIRDAVPGIDWAEVARVYVVGRTPEECRARWINHEDSVINKGPWKKMEDKKLLSIAQQHNFCAWEEIAEKLGTNRTPAECLIRYQRSLNASIMRSNWTPEEDNQLRAAVGEWGENDWSAVAACLEGRNNSQCLMRWYKVLHPTKKKRGRWSVEEDKRLKWAVSVYGPKKWKQIAEHVPGRTDLQCRERWCNVLDPSVKLGEWTEDEDRILLESVAKHGPHRWAAVANDLKIRTDNQCCRRWKFLHPEDQPEFMRTVHIRRTALVGNFQGRKKERPRLGPQDFISKGLDFEMYARKAAGKRYGKGKARIRPTEGVDAVQSMPSEEGSRERRAVRILKRRLARARQASSDDSRQKTVSRQASNNDRGQITGSAPDFQADSGLIDLNTSPDAVSTELGNRNKSGEGRKRKAVQVSTPFEPRSRSKRTKRNASQAAATIDNSTRSAKGRQRKAFRGQIIVSAAQVQTDNELIVTNNEPAQLGPDTVGTGLKRKALNSSDSLRPGSRSKRTKLIAPHVPKAIVPPTTPGKWRMRKAARGQMIVAAPDVQTNKELTDTNNDHVQSRPDAGGTELGHMDYTGVAAPDVQTTNELVGTNNDHVQSRPGAVGTELGHMDYTGVAAPGFQTNKELTGTNNEHVQSRPDAVGTELGHIYYSGEGLEGDAVQIVDPLAPGTTSKRTKLNATQVPVAVVPSTTPVKCRMRKAARGQIIVAAPDVQTDKEVLETNNVLRPDAVSTESGMGTKQTASQFSDISNPFNKKTKQNASHIADPIDLSTRAEIMNPIEAGKRTKLQVRRLTLAISVSHSQDAADKVQ